MFETTIATVTASALAGVVGYFAGAQRTEGSPRPVVDCVCEIEHKGRIDKREIEL